MKKNSFLILFLLLCLSVMSQKAVISFEDKNHDFGKINEEVGKVSCNFTFVNKGPGPLVINRVQTTCGCTSPLWTKEPIEPGKKGTITVTYSTTGRPGNFNKPITVFSNAVEEQVTLKITGEVIPKHNSDVDPNYPFNFGGILAKSKYIHMNSVVKGEKQTRSFEIYNSNNVAVRPTFEGLPSYISATVIPEMLKPNQDGKIVFTFNSKTASQWGPNSDEFYLVVNGKKDFSDDFKLTVYCSVVDDFSKLTLDQKRKSPILEMPIRTLNFGTLKVGSKKTGKLKLANRGVNPLEIRRIINNSNEIKCRNTKMTLSSGKSSDIVLDLLTKNLTEGDYKKSITIYTNDPDNSSLLLIISWRVAK